MDVHCWPACGAAAKPRQDLLVLAVETPDTPNRERARQLVRAALAEVLGAHLGCGAGGVRFVSVPGKPLRLDREGVNIGLSVSHEPGLSLAAIHFAGPVGVDLLRVPHGPEWQDEIALLARDYLGPLVARELAAWPRSEQVVRFAAHWSALEASLKALGRELEEWSPVLQRCLAGCRQLPLQLPAGFAGSLAVPVVSGGGPQFRQ